MGETTSAVGLDRLDGLRECAACGACVATTGQGPGLGVLCGDCVDAARAPVRLPGPVGLPPPERVSAPGARHADRRRWPGVPPTAGAAAGGVAGAGIPAQRRRLVPEPSEVDTMPDAWLERVCGEDSVVLHGRSRGRTGRGEIDHLAVTGSGVHVIAVRRAYGAPVTVRRGRTRSARHQRLLVGERDETGVVDRLHAQVLEVSVALGTLAVPVHALIWFIEGELPQAARGSALRRGRVLHVRDVPVAGTHGIGALLTRPGAVLPGRRREIAAQLDRELPG